MSIGADAWAATASLALTALLISAALTAILMRYAHARQLIDMPGRRRSHSQPTPRGGGIGFVIALLLCGLLPRIKAAPGTSLLLAAAVIAVAAVGFWDDHQPQPASVRVAVQIFAAILVLAALVPMAGAASATLPVWFATLAVGVALVWSINLHNFMDGSNGLLALQFLFVSCMIALAAHCAGLPMMCRLALVGGAAVAGFVPFNFPRAGVFMGDVGSGALGLWLGILAIMSVNAGALSVPAIAVLFSAFAIDATLTLAARMAQRRRWYSAHREHLYQWLVRSGGSHTRVAGLYMLWNVVIVAPVAVAILQTPGIAGWAAAAAVYVAGGVLWYRARQNCLRQVRRSGGHDVAT